jgi:hypothetical protein
VHQPVPDRGVQSFAIQSGQYPPDRRLGRAAGWDLPARTGIGAGQQRGRDVVTQLAIAVNERIPATTAAAHSASTAASG